MKKAVTVLLTCVILMVISIGAFAVDEESWRTDNYLNGRWIADCQGSKYSKDLVHTYILGVLDAIAKINDGLLIKAYGDKFHTDDIEAAVALYYQNNPLKRDRTIVEVILSGCK